MSKEIIKEKNKRIISIEVMLYCIFIAIGYVLLAFPEIEALKPIEYASPIFYILGFFGLIAYFANRRKGDYEFLIFGFINIFVASFIFVNSYYPNTGFILGNALFVYSIANILNKGYHTLKLSNEKDINMFPKLAITILITLLGVLVITNLYKETTMQTLVLGYYFTAFGVISLFEPIVILIIKNKKLKNYLVRLLDDENIEVKKENVIKPVKSVKPVKPVKEVKLHNIEKVKVKSNVKSVKKVDTTKKVLKKKTKKATK